jgi:hypothetical protein
MFYRPNILWNLKEKFLSRFDVHQLGKYIQTLLKSNRFDANLSLQFHLVNREEFRQLPSNTFKLGPILRYKF